jgi:hypothetical protein
MKKIGYFAIALCLTILTLWSAILAIELIEKIHYLPSYFRASTSPLSVTPYVAFSPYNNNTAGSASVADETTEEVPAPKDHPPLQIICGAHIFRVVYAPHDWLIRKRKPAYAMTEMDKELIILDRQRDAIQVREDVLHELIHIAIWESGGKSPVMPSEEESYVKPIAPPLRDILADNPKLVVWLTKAGG